MEPTTNTTGTHLQGHLETRFSHLVRAFGEPHDWMGDGYKTDVEWAFETPYGVGTIYNWKDGKNYLGSAGSALDDIREWHVGGTDERVVDYFKKELHSLRVRGVL